MYEGTGHTRFLIWAIVLQTVGARLAFEFVSFQLTGASRRLATRGRFVVVHAWGTRATFVAQWSGRSGRW
jgi:hypothetical protein